jgi:hypothetical protein
MMKKQEAKISASEQTWVLSSLEHDQLANAKKHPIPRRHLKGPELLVLWALRLYLLFMMAVVAYQVWTAARCALSCFTLCNPVSSVLEIFLLPAFVDLPPPPP